MSHYFSRLAQRSGVASTAANIRHGNSSGNAAPDWSEQSVETTAPHNAFISNSESVTSASAIENKSIHNSRLALSSAATQSINMPSNPMSAQQHQKKSDSINASVNTSLLSDTLNRESNLIVRNSSQDSTIAETSVFLSKPNEPGSKSELLLTSTKHTSVTFDQPIAADSSLKESFTEGKARTKALRKTPTETTEHSSARAHSIQSTPVDVEYKIDDTGKHEVHTPVLSRASAVQSKHAGAPVEQIKNIASAPAQTPVLSLQTPRAAPRSSIEVHIGKIELEIFSPTRKSAPAPAPAKVQTPRASPAAAFNPHRHYLRSR